MQWIIKSAFVVDPQTKRPLFWNRTTGWVDQALATRFNDVEKHSFHQTNMGIMCNASWVMVAPHIEMKHREDAFEYV